MTASCSTAHLLLLTSLRRRPAAPQPPRGLTKLIHRRRKLLEYMRSSMFERYMALIQRLGLKDVYFKQVGCWRGRAGCEVRCAAHTAYKQHSLACCVLEAGSAALTGLRVAAGLQPAGLAMPHP